MVCHMWMERGAAQGSAVHFSDTFTLVGDHHSELWALCCLHSYSWSLGIVCTRQGGASSTYFLSNFQLDFGANMTTGKSSSHDLRIQN
jgi:hypothetical protein